MIITIPWLKEHLKTTAKESEIINQLTNIGLEVEEVKENSGEMSKFKIAKVLKVEKHPNANKLKICNVDIGQNENLQIVCGAENVREGIHVLVATVGAHLKAINLKIKASSIRGIESHGMICSLSEIGLESASKGIAVLNDIPGELAALGSNPADLLGLNDIILDLAITANRPDGMSMVGIAREVSAIKKIKLNLPNINFNKSEYSIFNATFSQNISC